MRRVELGGSWVGSAAEQVLGVSGVPRTTPGNSYLRSRKGRLWAAGTPETVPLVRKETTFPAVPVDMFLCLTELSHIAS